MKQITKNIRVETEFMGCNTGFLVTSKGLVLIDSPFRPTDGIRYKKEIEEYGKVRYLINTEPHVDHVASNFMFDCVRIAQRLIRETMSADGYVTAIRKRLAFVDPDFIPNLPDFEVPLPEIEFSEDLDLYLGNHSLILIHLPGHTAGETAVYIPEEKVVFTGDNICFETMTYMHEALPSQWLKSLERLKALDADYIVSGHGGICGRDYIDRQATIIREWMDVIGEAIRKGWSLQEAQERITFLDRYPMEGPMKTMARDLELRGVTRLYGLAREGRM